MVPCRLLLVLSVSAVLTLRTVAQSEPDAIERTLPAWFSAEACDAIPHSEVQVCVPAPFEGVPLSPVVSPPALASITLKVAEGTPLRIAIDDRTRIQDVGEPIHGKLMEGVYSFDQEVIPAGSVATGKVTRIAAVSGFRRTLAYANGNLTPFHEYEVTFDSVTLPSGKQIAIHTSARAGTAEVVHLVSNPDKQEKGAAGRATDRARAEAKGKIAEAKEEAHDAWEKLTAPGKMNCLKEFLLAQSPYRHQYLLPGTRFLAELKEPIDFGETTRTSVQLAAVGSQPVTDTTLKARLVAEVSSATATRGTAVTALLTEPVYSPEHQLILPANTRLVGQVIKAKAARKMHRNGELRVVFERIETSEDVVKALAQLQTQEQAKEAAEQAAAPRSQAMTGNLEGVEVDRNAHMELDEEGGAHTTTSKTRYLSTGLAVVLAAAASHTEVEHGTTEIAGPGVRTAAGGSGFRATGALLSLAAKSTPVSVALGAYGAGTTLYANFIRRGSDVVLAKDTPMEIGFGPPHTKAP